MEVYITKYALTKGIEKIDVTEVGNGMVRTDDLFGHFHGEGREWHREKESAIAKAKEMRDKKIKNLKEQIKKLENMRFDDIDGENNAR